MAPLLPRRPAPRVPAIKKPTLRRTGKVRTSSVSLSLLGCSDVSLDKKYVSNWSLYTRSQLPATAPSLRNMPGNRFLLLIPATSWLSLSRNIGNFSPRQEQLGGIILSKCSISVPKPNQRGMLYSMCPSNSHLCVWSVSYAHSSHVPILCALEIQSPSPDGPCLTSACAAVDPGGTTAFLATFLADCFLLSLSSFSALLAASET